MALVLKSPQVHSTFSNLGFMHADGYQVNENCNAALENILHNILTEDKYLRGYRRSINFGQNIQKDLIPLLIHAKEDKTIELLVTILLNLSIPIECLLSVEVTSQSNNGFHTVYEINQLLTAIKAAFTEPRTTKVVVEFLKKNMVPQPKVSQEQCTNISNGLLLLRNILYIPEDVNSKPSNNGSNHPIQNQIVWNMFSENIDKVLMMLMLVPEATNWAVTIVQFVGLLYKDQDVGTLQKLLNVWLKSYSFESSEDNESNTSTPNRGSENSSLMLTSAPTSDSSDMSNCETNGRGGYSEHPTTEDANQPLQPPLPDENDVHMSDQDAPPGDEHMKSAYDHKVVPGISPTATAITNGQQPDKTEKNTVISETTDFGYVTQIENQESISTSSNDDDLPSKKPVHHKPHKPKQKVNTKARSGAAPQAAAAERKKGTTRGKTNIMNVKGLPHQAPTDADVSNLLKEFTVEFLRQGYNSLVQTLHTAILTNVHLEIDSSHFSWLLTYFLKFVTQIELDLEQISAVLSFDIVSFLTAEGVNLCEQFELAVKLDVEEVKTSGQRLHLVVIAIREFVQALEVYKMFPHICADDKDGLLILQDKMCETAELRSLLVLLLRHYKPRYHTKQYLQDLIITNHMLLKFVDSGMRSMKYTGAASMAGHLEQFAAPEIMCLYGLVLEDFAVNGELINDCVFTIMHHVAGQLGSLSSLHEPNILKAFASIKTSEFQICDDWSDLIEYVINTFIKKPLELPTIGHFKIETQVIDDVDDKLLTELAAAKKEAKPEKRSAHSTASQPSNHRWTEEELSSLRWIYLQCNTHPDVVGQILKCLKEEGTVKTRGSVIRELHKKNIINKEEYEKLSKAEVQSRYCKKTQLNKENREVEIGKLCEQLRQDGKTKCLDWVQQVLLEICYAKLEIEKRYLSECCSSEDRSGPLTFKILNQECKAPVVSPVAHRALLLNESVPLVPWNSEQAAVCKNLYFLQLLYKLGFQMPVDSGKVFIRIPHVWPAGVVYEVAGYIAVVDTTKLKFSISDLTSSSSESTPQQCSSALPTHPAQAVTSFTPAPGSFTRREGAPCSGNAQPEGDNRCWLQMVQQSQRLKLACAVGSVVADVEDLTEAPELPPRDSGAQLADLDEDNSVSDTASVASDLTRMYVSDEDEEKELALRPRVAKPWAHGGARRAERDLERVATRPPRDRAGSRSSAAVSEAPLLAQAVNRRGTTRGSAAASEAPLLAQAVSHRGTARTTRGSAAASEAPLLAQAVSRRGTARTTRGSAAASEVPLLAQAVSRRGTARPPGALLPPLRPRSWPKL